MKMKKLSSVRFDRKFRKNNLYFRLNLLRPIGSNLSQISAISLAPTLSSGDAVITPMLHSSFDQQYKHISFYIHTLPSVFHRFLSRGNKEMDKISPSNNKIESQSQFSAI